MLVDIAGLGVEIKGDHQIVELLKEDYRQFPKAEEKFLTFEFISGFPEEKPEEPFIDQRTDNWSKPLRNLAGSRETLIEIDEEQNYVRVYCSPTIENRKILNFFYRFYDQTFLGRLGVMAIDVTYGIIEPLFNYFAVDEGRCLIHASAVNYQGKTMVFAGEGGVGKTSMLLSTPKQSAKFFGDDFVGIDAEGNIYPYPKKIMMYGHNTLGLRHDNPSNGILDMIQWKFRFALNSSKVRRRITFSELGLQISDFNELDFAFYLTRGSSCQRTILSNEEMATRACESTYLEHKEILEELDKNYKAELYDTILGLVREIDSCKKIKVIENYSPKQLSNYVYSQF